MNLQSHIGRLGIQPIINKVVNDLNPVAIVCFGLSASSFECLNCFQTYSSKYNHLDLLIVQYDKCPYKGHEVVDLLKNIFSKHITVNVFAHREESVVREIQKGNPFFCKVLNQGFKLYHNKNSNLDTILIDLDSSESKVTEWIRSFELANKFLVSADEAIKNQAYDMGVFLLHQSVEQMCIASVNAHLKYRITSHSIIKSLGLVGCYIPQVRELFPCNTKLEQELFQYLNKAYSDVRYKAGYTIPACIAVALLERAYTLMNLIETCYRNEYAYQH